MSRLPSAHPKSAIAASEVGDAAGAVGAVVNEAVGNIGAGVAHGGVAHVDAAHVDVGYGYVEG